MNAHVIHDENAQQHLALAQRPGKAAGKARAVPKKKRALADISNSVANAAPRRTSAHPTAKPDPVVSGGVLTLAAAEPQFTRARDAVPAYLRSAEPMQLDGGPESPEFKAAPAALDIDACDAGSHLHEAHLARSIHASLLRRERALVAPADYMQSQRDVTAKMRSILVDWLVDVHVKFELRADVLALTVNIIDRFLAAAPVQRRKLQLVGITAMLIASKYEEIYAPCVADFVYISDKTYNETQILAMEALILNKLEFQVTTPYPTTFLRRCLKALRATVGYDVSEVTHLANYVLDLAMQDLSMLAFLPSQQAAAATLLSASLLLEDFIWGESMRVHSGGWMGGQLVECIAQMRTLLVHEQDPQCQNKLTAIKRKYSGEKYGEIATLAATHDLSMDDGFE